MNIKYLFFLTLIIAFLILLIQVRPVLIDDQSFAKKREAMVAQQIIARGVKDSAVLKAMRKVPRHLFVPSELRGQAYIDGPLPVGYHQTISQPYIVAYMTEAVALSKNDRVLEIGTGSGYQAAVLAEMAKEVYTIEIVEGLAKEAKTRLTNMGYHNIFFKHGDGYNGWKEYAPFDV